VPFYAPKARAKFKILDSDQQGHFFTEKEGPFNEMNES